MAIADRALKLQSVVDQYVTSEQTRITNEVSVLKAILTGRKGGAGAQQLPLSLVAAAAYNDMAAFISGK